MNKNKWKPYIRIGKNREWIREDFTLFRIKLSYTGHVYLIRLTLFSINLVIGMTSRGLKPIVTW